VETSAHSSTLILYNNVQFIYELTLAKLEIESFCKHFDISDDMRRFDLNGIDEHILESIRQRAAYFQSVAGHKTTYSYIVSKNRTRSVNQYLTHWIYPYKGKFHPQMIRALLNIIGLRPGDTLFEPFCGSGTAILETELLGINSVGIDISPLCITQTRVKTEELNHIEEIRKLKNLVIDSVQEDLFSKPVKFYDLLKTLTAIPQVQEFYIMARMLALSDESRRGRDFKSSFIKNVNLMIDSISDFAEIITSQGISIGSSDINIGDARSTGWPDNYFDGVITSPPYSIALDYVQNDIHALLDMGYDPSVVRECFIGVRGTGYDRIKNYNEDMIQAYSEIYRVLKQNKFAVIVIGNAVYQNREIDSVKFTIDTMCRLGFECTHNINKIIFGLYNFMKSENILIFRKT